MENTPHGKVLKNITKLSLTLHKKKKKKQTKKKKKNVLLAHRPTPYWFVCVGWHLHSLYTMFIAGGILA